MRKARLVLIIAAIAMGGTLMTSCKKKARDPAYPQFVGTWAGKTSQSRTVQVRIENKGGDLYVTYAYLSYSQGASDSTVVSRSNSDGLALVSGTSFTVVLDGTAPTQTFIQGTFRTDTLKLSGNFTGYTSEFLPITGTYTATRIAK
jgi:hypothetical protein